MFGKPRLQARTLLRCLSWFPKAVVNVPELLYDIKGLEFFGFPIPDVFAIVYTPPLRNPCKIKKAHFFTFGDNFNIATAHPLSSGNKI